MDFLLIGESKIKIVLSESEAAEHNLDECISESLDAGVRRSFWRILDKARDAVGFDPSGDKVLIQLYPIKGGGCEMFVTKLGILPESSARLVSRSSRLSVLQRQISLYYFDSMDDLIGASKAIKAQVGNEKIVSDVYLFGMHYFLSIEEYGKGGEPIEFLSILEFGSRLTADLCSYIHEHAKLLTAGDGIDRFASL